MGNKILGKRSRSFYKGFNQSQVNYIKQKFSTLSKDGFLDKTLFIQAYQINETLCDKFFAFVDFDQSSQLQQYEFICAVHSFCNMTIEELGSLFFNMCSQKQNSNIKQKDLLNFTQSCIKYNCYLEKKPIPKDDQISKINKNKFKKYDFDKNGSLDKDQFIKVCMKDQDYKKWMFNMGFITKKQLQCQNQVYDLVDSDIQGEIDRHLNQSDPNVSKIKRGIQHRLDDDQFAVMEVAGEQSVVQKMPWIKSVQKFGWSDKFKQNPNSPSQTLTMSYVFGYRSYDCRNNLKFDSNGNIVYHQATVGIVMKKNPKQKKASYSQSFITEHRDDISCLDIVKNTVVTGQVGSKPMILLWETDKTGIIEPKLIITKQLQESVGNVCLSSSLKLLAVNCNDPQHTLIVYDIDQLYKLQKDLTSKATGIVSSGPLTKHIIFDLKFSIEQKNIVAATLQQLIFITFQNGNLNSDRGDFNNFSNSPALCLLPLTVNLKGKTNYMLSGMANGSIYFWQESKCVKALCGHSGSVSALTARQDCLSFVSGDKSGKIIVWSAKLQKQKTYVLPKTNSPSNMIVALSCNSGKQMLIGTKSASVYKLKIGEQFSNSQLLMQGHCQGNINGLAVSQSPTQKNFFTGGDDMRLIKWEYGQSNQKLLQKKLQYKIKSIDFDYKKNTLALGYQNGVVQLFDSNLEKQNLVFSKIKNPDQQALNIVKISPKDRTIGVAYTYPKYQIKILQIDLKNKNLKQTFSLVKQSKIIAFDFDTNGKFLRVNTADFKFFVHDIQKNQEIKQQDSKLIKECAWNTHTTFLSSETQGFLTQGVTEGDIVCCERNRFGKNVFILGDKYSKIKLFNYPCKQNPIFNKYNGHSNKVTAIQFNNIKNDEYLISIGGQEKSIITWKYDPDLGNNQMFMVIDEQKKQEVDQFAEAEEEGQQAGSTNHYKGQIFPPSDFRQNYNPKKDNKKPKQSISIHHVFGLRNKYLTDQVRNQCKFTEDFQHVIFPTACLGVKMNIESRDQQFYLAHKQDIVSFAVDSKRELMATGQMAEKNQKTPKDKILSIYVWDIQSKTVLKKLDGFHTIAVVLLQFSPSSKLLFSVGNDTKNTFAVYDWRSGAILYSGPISQGKVNGICWKSQTQFITCGNDHVKLWSNGKGTQAKFNPGQKPEPMFCCTSSENVYITGSGSKKGGFIYNWIGGTSKNKIQAHKGKVQALVVKDKYVYSGGDDGIILQWTKQKNGQIQKQQKSFDTREAYSNIKIDINTMQAEQFGVLSIDFNNNNKVLIATKGASIILWDRLKKKSQIIHCGHYEGQLWGLTTKGDDEVFMTGGDDKTVRLWSIKNKRQEKRIYFQNKVRGMDYQKSGKIVVADFTAKIYLLDSQLGILDQYTGKPYQTNKKAKLQPWVEQIKFSPDSKFIAYGTHAKSRELQYIKVEGNKLKLHNTFFGGSSALLHLDWSRNSDSISVNTQAYQYYFFDLNGKDQRASSLADQKWATWTKKLGFPVQGIFQGADLTDVNTVCRSPDSQYLAVGYDDQTIRLFKYPCYIPRQEHKVFYGHSSHVTRIRFCKNYMISTGGEDKTIIIWNIDQGQTKAKKKYGQDQESDGLQDLDQDVDLPNKAIMKKKIKQKNEEFHQIVDAGDQFMAVKPWLGAIKQPSYKYPNQTSKQPKAQIKLSYVFGYRTKDCRQNLFYSDKQTIIYHAAAVLIYHDIQKNQQSLLTQHNDDILSIDFNKKTGRVVTGQLGPKPIMCFYENGKLIQKFKAPVTKGILSVALSLDGNLAVCVGMDEDHQVCVIDLKNNRVLSKQKGGKKVILKAKWVSNNEFVTIGINHYRYWTLQKSLKFKESKQKGNFVSIDTSSDGMIVTGANKGSVYSWQQSQKKKQAIIQLTKKSQKGKQQKFQASIIQSIKIVEQEVICGTKDGYIAILNKNLEKIKEFNMKQIFQMSKVPSQNPGIRSIDSLNSKLLLGTFGSQIYEVNYQQGMIKQKTCKNIVKCHYSPNNTWTNQVWGLAIDHDNIYTCSDDATVRSWSLNERKLTSCTSLNTSIDIKKQNQMLQMDKKTKDFVQAAKGRSVGVSPDGQYLVVGSKDGTVRIYKVQKNKGTLKNIQNFKHAKEWISDIKFGFNTLIIGSHDNGIYVYDFQEGVAKLKYKPLKKHSSYITHIDVSRDSCYLQSTCGAYELLFWDVNSGKQLTSGATMLKDQRWASWTSNLGWPVQGIYPKCTDGTFINSVDRSNLSINNTLAKDDQTSPYLLAAGNDNGKVCLYNYPCTIKSSKFVEGVGHSSHVTNVRWNQNDKYLISVGGEDQCLMIWKVDKNK